MAKLVVMLTSVKRMESIYVRELVKMSKEATDVVAQKELSLSMAEIVLVSAALATKRL